VQTGSLRDSTHGAYTGTPAAWWSTVPPTAGKEIDGKTAGRLAVYSAGTELS
jgi:hypothetical protein